MAGNPICVLRSELYYNIADYNSSHALNYTQQACRPRGVGVGGKVPGVPWHGTAMAPPDFGRSVNPISTMETRLCPPNNTGHSEFSDLRTALHNDVFNNDYLSIMTKCLRLKVFVIPEKKQMNRTNI